MDYFKNITMKGGKHTPYPKEVQEIVTRWFDNSTAPTPWEEFVKVYGKIFPFSTYKKIEQLKFGKSRDPYNRRSELISAARTGKRKYTKRTDKETEESPVPTPGRMGRPRRTSATFQVIWHYPKSKTNSDTIEAIRNLLEHLERFTSGLELHETSQYLTGQTEPQQLLELRKTV